MRSGKIRIADEHAVLRNVAVRGSEFHEAMFFNNENAFLGSIGAQLYWEGKQDEPDETMP